MPGFHYLFRHRARISLSFPESCQDFIIFSSIVFRYPYLHRNRTPIRSLLLFRVLRHHARILSLHFISGSPASCQDSIPLFCFKFSGIAPEFDIFFYFSFSGLALGFDPFFCFRFSCIALGFDPFVLFRILRYHTRIRSFLFISCSPASSLDLIPSFISGSLASGPDSILSFISGSPASRPASIPYFVSGSPASCLDSTPAFYFGFSDIAPGFDFFVLFWILQHRA